MKYGFEEAADTLRNRISFRFGTRTVSRKEKLQAQKHSRPKRVRMALEELGPTFIKLGQLLSTRPDLVPPDYIEELEKLQDEVSPDKFTEIRAEIESQLGGDLYDFFPTFDAEPLAAGSIAQVHRAVTKEGDQVAVKACRPGIAEKVQAELHILRDIAGLLKLAFFEHEAIDPQQMVDEFAEAVRNEVDLSIERQNQIRFLQFFADDKTVHIPKVYEQYCTTGILTMEYIKGIKPTHLEEVRQAGLDPKIIASRGADFVLRQIFEVSLFHADPHPGNFFLLADNVLAPLDFGQVARLSRADQTLLQEMVLSIVEDDAARMLQALGRAEMMPETADTSKITREAEQLLDTYHALPLKDIPFNKVISQIFDIIRRHNIRPPAQFTLMLKSLMTIESFALGLDSEFNIIDHLKPFAQRFAKSQLDPRVLLKDFKRAAHDAGDLIAKFPDDVNSLLNKFRQGKFQMRIHHEHLDNLIHTLDISSNRVSFSLIISALLIASSMLVAQEGNVLGMSLQTLGLTGYIVAAIIGIWLLISIIRSRHL